MLNMNLFIQDFITTHYTISRNWARDMIKAFDDI